MPNDDLNLEKLTKKLVTLLALSTAQRAQTLFAIPLANIMTIESLKNPHHRQAKNLKAGTSKNKQYSKSYSSENRQVYAQLRPLGEDRLFITFKKPYQAATTQSISQWIKPTLGECGSHVTFFSEHSTRHASTSAVVRRGMSIKAIKRTEDRSKNSQAFAKFYNRER